MDLQQIKQKLQAMRHELLEIESSASEAEKPVILDQQSVGRLSRMDAMQGQQMAQANKRRRELMLKAIAAAEHRIASGTFGECLDCEEKIAEKRLAFDPTTLYCLECMTEREQKRDA